MQQCTCLNSTLGRRPGAVEANMFEGPRLPVRVKTGKAQCEHMTSALPLPAQPVDATQALNLSAGVSNCKVSRGRSFSWRATLFKWACECTDKSVPLGKYC